MAYSKFNLCCCRCCQGYAIEVCNLVIRSRLPGRHRAEAGLLCWFLLSPSRVAPSHSSVSLLQRDREWWKKSVWCVCVHCVAQLSLSFIFFCDECVYVYKNYTLTTWQKCHNVPLYVLFCSVFWLRIQDIIITSEHLPSPKYKWKLKKWMIRVSWWKINIIYMT